MTEVPTILLEGLTEEREREIIVRDNVENGEWDFDILANEWDTEKLNDWGVEMPWTKEEPERTDVDADFNALKIEIECETEEQQEEIYNELIDKGYKCKIV